MCAGPLQDQRHARSQGQAEPAIAAVEPQDRPVEPAVLRAIGFAAAVLQHVLPVEMGAVAIAGGGGRDEQQFARPVERHEIAERRMQAEIAVEIEGQVGRKRQGGPQTAIIPVAVGRQGVQAVEPATQQNQDEAPVRRRGGEGGADERRGRRGRRRP